MYNKRPAYAKMAPQLQTSFHPKIQDAPMIEMQYELHSEEEMLMLGHQMSAEVSPPAWIFLKGPLGAGKTTWVRGFLRGLGYAGKVRSPTYTLIESYPNLKYPVLHLDLYRLSGQRSEAMGLGLEDYAPGSSVVLVEWPEQGETFLPQPNWAITIGVGETDAPETWRMVWVEKK